MTVLDHINSLTRRCPLIGWIKPQGKALTEMLCSLQPCKFSPQPLLHTLTIWLMKLHHSRHPLCSLHFSRWQTEKDRQHPWGVTRTVRRWLLQVNADTAESRALVTPTPPFTAYTADDSAAEMVTRVLTTYLIVSTTRCYIYTLLWSENDSVLPMKRWITSPVLEYLSIN